MESVRGKDLLKIGYKEGPAISLILAVLNGKEFKNKSFQEKLDYAEDVMVDPEKYRGLPEVGKVVDKLYPPKKNTDLREVAVPVQIFGNPIIEMGAINQIFLAAKLPVSYKAALMPDAHSGYGLPIGGVLACENAVIPYGVGVDIGCRMSMSILPIDPEEFFSKPAIGEKILDRVTFFGAGGETPRSSLLRKVIDYSIMDDPLFDTKFLSGMKSKAYGQLGTSGSGNHFVEFGILEIPEEQEINGIKFKGSYTTILSHSGSRGLGAYIARNYTDKAKKLRKLDPTVSNLAWLTLDEQEGYEYWEYMNLAGRYAKSCHDNIHKLICRELRVKPITNVENHHNFAWKENHDGKDLIVHRKGATPAGNGVLGIIPGSMSTPGFLVRGLGNSESLNSASHGAGRAMSRTKAKETFAWSDIKKEMKLNGISVIGGGADESTGSYKDINQVMSFHTNLVDILGTFKPKIVRMAGEDQEPEE